MSKTTTLRGGLGGNTGPITITEEEPTTRPKPAAKPGRITVNTVNTLTCDDADDGDNKVTVTTTPEAKATETMATKTPSTNGKPTTRKKTPAGVPEAAKAKATGKAASKPAVTNTVISEPVVKEAVVVTPPVPPEVTTPVEQAVARTIKDRAMKIASGVVVIGLALLGLAWYAGVLEWWVVMLGLGGTVVLGWPVKAAIGKALNTVLCTELWIKIVVSLALIGLLCFAVSMSMLWPSIVLSSCIGVTTMLQLLVMEIKSAAQQTTIVTVTTEE